MSDRHCQVRDVPPIFGVAPPQFRWWNHTDNMTLQHFGALSPGNTTAGRVFTPKRAH
jgi:hypothetical protein